MTFMHCGAGWCSTVVLVMVSVSDAAIITVGGGGKYDYMTIQEAVWAASNGDEIIVAPGEYDAWVALRGDFKLDEVVNTQGKAIWIHSSQGPEVTFISGLGETRGIRCSSGETADTHIEGFTVRDCVANGGAGMLIDHAGPTITNCIFEDNLSEQSYYYTASGGAIFIEAGNPAIVDCVFRSNHAEYNGGAIYSKNFSAPSISTCVFEDNTALKGGAICNSSSSTADISGCLFSENVAEYYGGAIYLLEYCTITLSKCSMLSNAAGYFGAGVYSQGGTMTAIGCTFNQNSVSGVDGWGGGGGIGMNGEGVGGNTTVSGNEFKDNTAPDGGGILNESGALSVGTTLFCGNNTGDIGGDWTDLGGNGFYGVCDQGACCTNDTCVPIDQKTCLYVGGEYQGLYVACADAACPISCFGDVTEDGVVDVSDVLGVIGAWGACP